MYSLLRMITFTGKKVIISATENKNLIGWFLFEYMLSLKQRVLLFVPTSSYQTAIFLNSVIINYHKGANLCEDTA